MVHHMTDKQRLDDEAKLKPAEAAEVLRVSTRTLTRMADRGELSIIKLPSGHNRYLRSEIELLAQPAQAVHA